MRSVSHSADEQLLAQLRLQRWSRRAAVALMATVGVALLATPAAAVVVLLLHAI